MDDDDDDYDDDDELERMSYFPHRQCLRTFQICLLGLLVDDWLNMPFRLGSRKYNVLAFVYAGEVGIASHILLCV